MTNIIEVGEDCDSVAGRGAVAIILLAKTKDLGNFSVRRLLPTVKRRKVGPWVFFDHMGPALFPAGEGLDVRPHPHIGIATVTYLFEGEILHRDSLGSVQAIRPGDINLMVAGRGITHSERERPEVQAVDHRVHGLQLWLALPEALEQMDPVFYHYSDHVIPELQIDGVKVRVMIGEAYEAVSPVKTFSPTLYIEAFLQPGQTLTLPQADERAIYVAEGELAIGTVTLPQYAMAVLSSAEEVTITAVVTTRTVLIGGAAISPRLLEWNFVASDSILLDQAKRDWREKRFPTIPGDDLEFIPLP